MDNESNNDLEGDLINIHPTGLLGFEDGLSIAHQLMNQGDLIQAKYKYLEILGHYGESSQVLMLLGLLEGQLGNLEAAVNHFIKVTVLEPSNINARTALALCKQNLNEFQQAINHYEEALEILTQNVSQSEDSTHLELKRECLDQICQLESVLKDFDSALSYALRVHQIRPDLNSFVTLARIYLQLNANALALKTIDHAMVNYPEEVRVYLLKGLIFEKLIVSDVSGCNVSSSSSSRSRSQGKNNVESVLSSYSKAIKIAPNAAQSFYIKANFLSSLSRWQDAIENYEMALQLNPSHLLSLNNALVAYQSLGMYEQANNCIDRFLVETNQNPKLIDQLEQGASQFFFNAGALQLLKGDFNKARIYFEKSLLTDSHCPQLLGAYYHLRMRLCDWESKVKINDGDSILELGFDELQVHLLKEVGLKSIVTHPFALLTASDDPLLHRLANLRWTQSILELTYKQGIESQASAIVKSIPKQIRIGYFSNDFKEHATAYLIASLFELHDKGNFQIFVYSWSTDDQSTMRNRLINSVDRWNEVGNLSDKELVALARLHELDIAIDLKGHTEGARTQVFAARVAPVQIVFLGYPGTMGAEFIDYCIADEVVVPVESQHYMTERVLYMPESYQVNDEKRAISPLKTARIDHGLPDNGLILCSFNSSYKITPVIFDYWMGILAEFTNCVLWLLDDNKTASDNLRQRAIAKGIDAHRLIFAPKFELAEHLERLSHADLFLDTFPCNAHTTASDALWSGVPLITLTGQSFASRVAASLLIHTGLSHLIAYTEGEYVLKIRNLVMNPGQLKVLKSDLLARKRNKQLTLFDSQKFTRDFENLLRSIFE